MVSLLKLLDILDSSWLSKKILMKKSILIVEASFVVRTVLGFLLESEGFTVDTAANGIEGLGKIHSNPYDLAIISGDLPKLHGYELVWEVRKIKHHKNLPILLITKGEPLNKDLKLQHDNLLYLLDLKEPTYFIHQVFTLLQR